MSEFKFKPFYYPKMGFILNLDKPEPPKQEFIPKYKLNALYPEQYKFVYVKDLQFKPKYNSF